MALAKARKGQETSAAATTGKAQEGPPEETQQLAGGDSADPTKGERALYGVELASNASDSEDSDEDSVPHSASPAAPLTPIRTAAPALQKLQPSKEPDSESSDDEPESEHSAQAIATPPAQNFPGHGPRELAPVATAKKLQAQKDVDSESSDEEQESKPET